MILMTAMHVGDIQSVPQATDTEANTSLLSQRTL